jgi:hypothetical protein
MNPMDPDAPMVRAARQRDEHVYRSSRLVTDHAPQMAGGPVAQYRPLTTGEYRGQIRRIVGLNRPNRIDAPIQRAQPAGLNPVVDQVRRNAGRDELVSRNHTVRSRECQDPSLDPESPGQLLNRLLVSSRLQSYAL